MVSPMVPGGKLMLGGIFSFAALVVIGETVEKLVGSERPLTLKVLSNASTHSFYLAPPIVLTVYTTSILRLSLTSSESE